MVVVWVVVFILVGFVVVRGLQQEGRIRSIGVSNFKSGTSRTNHRVDGGSYPAVNQIELHPRFQQEALRAVHGGRGVKTESWSPLGRGALLSDPVIVKLAAKLRKTSAQVIIRWHLESGLIVIPKSVHIDRLREKHWRGRLPS